MHEINNKSTRVRCNDERFINFNIPIFCRLCSKLFGTILHASAYQHTVWTVKVFHNLRHSCIWP